MCNNKMCKWAQPICTTQWSFWYVDSRTSGEKPPLPDTPMPSFSLCNFWAHKIPHPRHYDWTFFCFVFNGISTSRVVVHEYVSPHLLVFVSALTRCQTRVLLSLSVFMGYWLAMDIMRAWSNVPVTQHKSKSGQNQPPAEKCRNWSAVWHSDWQLPEDQTQAAPWKSYRYYTLALQNRPDRFVRDWDHEYDAQLKDRFVW